VLNHIDLCFKKGEWTGIVGPSGQGKSTILDIILKLYPVCDGTVFIDGTDINRMNAFSIRDQVTKIAQDVFLFPGTIEDNLRLMREGVSEEEMWEALRFACLDEYVKTMPQGIKTDVGEAGKLMSGGERQRLSIAMGILRGNQILLLDEVTSNLDIEIEERLAKHFYELVRKGYTIIAVSHRMSFLKHAQKVYEIQNGQAKEACIQ
jgi:ABC-type multidrug transport system fused ATPase/permease subunit